MKRNYLDDGNMAFRFTVHNSLMNAFREMYKLLTISRCSFRIIKIELKAAAAGKVGSPFVGC